MVMGSRALPLLLPPAEKEALKAADRMPTRELATAMINASGMAPQ
jgi:hypothetical protein